MRLVHGSEKREGQGQQDQAAIRKMFGSLLEGLPSGGSSHPGKRHFLSKSENGLVLLLLLFGVGMDPKRTEQRTANVFQMSPD